MRKVFWLFLILLTGCVDNNFFRNTTAYDSTFISVWNIYLHDNDNTGARLKSAIKKMENLDGQLQLFYLVTSGNNGILRNDTFFVNHNFVPGDYTYVSNYIAESEQLDSVFSLHRQFDLFQSKKDRSKIELIEYLVRSGGDLKMRAVWSLKKN